MGYLALVFMGMILGLVGAGGSIITIPILLYLFKIELIRATLYSTILVGATSAVACIIYKNNILIKRALIFIMPSALGVFLARYFIIPNLPNKIFNMETHKILMSLLLIFMFFGGYFSIKPLRNLKPIKQEVAIFLALIVGMIMGILGAGGGFLIIPSLMFILQFATQEAIATSLFIIFINCLVGYGVSPYTNHPLQSKDWSRLLPYLTCTFLGMGLGAYLSKALNSNKLKQIFGYFVWIIGLFIFIIEFVI